MALNDGSSGSWLQISNRFPMYAGSVLKIASQKATQELPFHATSSMAQVQMLNLRMGGPSWHVACRSISGFALRPQMETCRGLWRIWIEATTICPTTSNCTNIIQYIHFILFHISTIFQVSHSAINFGSLKKRSWNQQDRRVAMGSVAWYTAAMGALRQRAGWQEALQLMEELEVPMGHPVVILCRLSHLASGTLRMLGRCRGCSVDLVV